MPYQTHFACAFKPGNGRASRKLAGNELQAPTRWHSDDMVHTMFNHLFRLRHKRTIAIFILTGQAERGAVEDVRQILRLQQHRMGSIPHPAILSLPHTDDRDCAVTNDALIANLLERGLALDHAHAEVWSREVEETMLVVVSGHIDPKLINRSLPKQCGGTQDQRSVGKQE